MTRDILDFNGNVIGQLTLPDNTPDSVFDMALSSYAQPPPTPLEMVTDRIALYQSLSEGAIREMLAANTLQGITLAQSYQAMQQYGVILQMVRFGMFPTAIFALQSSAPSGFITQPMLDSWVVLLQSML